MSEKWKVLLERSRELSKESSDGTKVELSVIPLYNETLPQIKTLIHNYLCTLFKSSHEDSFSKDNKEIPTPTKILIIDTRRALRFALCLLAVESTRRHLQTQTVTQPIELHKVLSSLISQRKCDTKCRVMASQLMCNLGTSNALTASIIMYDIRPSPSKSEARDIMLGKLNINENSLSDVGSMSYVCAWSHMFHAAGGSGDRNSLAAIAAALHNSIVAFEQFRSDKDDVTSASSDFTATLPSLTKDSMLICNIIRYILPSEVIQQQQLQQQKNGGDNVDEEQKVSVSTPLDLSDSATEWISRLVEKLCSVGMLPNLYKSLGSGDDYKKDQEKEDERIESPFNFSNGITPEQLVLLHCVGNAVDQHLRTLHTVHQSSEKQVHPLGGQGACDSLLSTCHFLAERYCNFRQDLIGRTNHNDSSNKKSLESERYHGETACMKSASTLILDILSNCLSLEEQQSNNSDIETICKNNNGPHFSSIRLHLGKKTNLLQSILLELGIIVDKLGIENRGIKARELSVDEGDQHAVTSIVRLIGNICYRCPQNQNLVRETVIPVPNTSNGNLEEYTQLPTKKNDDDTNFSVDGDVKRNGLHVLLSCTSFAYGCFTLREWAIVAIRNVLEDNMENKRQIEELEAQQTIQTPELQKLGVKVKLDKRGQVRVSQDDVPK